MQTRRAALLTIAGAASSPLLAQHAGHTMADAAPPAISYQPVFFKQPDYALVSRLADLIIPKTETPGAVDAHVPYRIDQQVNASAELQSQFELGLQLLQAEAKDTGAADFVSLTPEQQIAILQSASDAPDTPQGQFFSTMKHLTVDWYYRSEEGLVKELGFHGNTFRPDFPGCKHPEHWPQATQESR